MGMHTPLTARLGVAMPIIGAPMAGVAHGALARAVTEGGGLGMIGVGSTDRAKLVAREVSPASGMGPPGGGFRHEDGTTFPPVMGPSGGIHRRRSACG